ncbi:MAG: hypothetical protein KAJ14_06540, partial [Candidatus Omnitrophica bacterium]|nr:hypothetical protein [Candidatus Omnitrophota bacterium]
MENIKRLKEIELPNAETVKEDILLKYPTKVAKKRNKSMVLNNPDEEQPIQSNVRTIPGIITQRGC